MHDEHVSLKQEGTRKLNWNKSPFYTLACAHRYRRTNRSIFNNRERCMAVFLEDNTKISSVYFPKDKCQFSNAQVLYRDIVQK